MTPIVSSEWLAAHLDDPDLRLLDASWYMPAEQRCAASEFLKAHIPGAQFFDVDEVADPDTPLPHMAPSPERFARLVGDLGIGNHHHVVFYDQKGLFSAGRGWWLFRLFGHQRVSVLDGGLPKWLAEGRSSERGPVDAVTVADYRPALRATLLRGLGDMLANLQSQQELVLDARSRGRFDGSAPDPRPSLPSGHIPGSRSLPYGELLNPDGTLLAVDALRAKFVAAGVDGSRPLVCSCGSGLTATVLALGLEVAGLGSAAVYDGSWTEWAAQPDTPKASGAA
ncbi:MAG TPA: 3-mercaptopyruvate sulfurtransferase [Rhodocyclaceae bacterium]